MNDSIVTFTLILIRIASFWFVVPVFGDIRPPRTVKVGLSVALAVFWFGTTEIPPGVTSAVASDLNVFSLGMLCVRELLIGVMLGFCFHLFLVPTRVAGSYLSQELGLSLATLSDPTNPETTTIVSTMLQMFGLLLFFTSNLHHYLIYLIDGLFRILPVASPISLESSGVLTEGLAGSVEQGLVVIGPVSIALLVLLLAIMILAKAVPAFNLFSVGISIRLVVGLLLILVFVPDILSNVAKTFVLAENHIEVWVESLVDG